MPKIITSHDVHHLTPNKRRLKENDPFMFFMLMGRLLEHTFVEPSCLDQFSFVQGMFCSRLVEYFCVLIFEACCSNKL